VDTAPTPPAAARPAPPRRERSKTVATWLAVVAGSLGAHRFYLHGPSDGWGWLHSAPTLLGLLGVLRMRTFGQDDRLAWVLLPLLGIMLTIGMLSAILIGLTSDEAWADRFGQPLRPTRWGPIIGVIVALALGAAALLSTVAFSGQKFFESRATVAAPALEERTRSKVVGRLEAGSASQSRRG
jgi:hypothetical protein